MIEVPPASFQTTPYGDVDSVALERLRANFDTTRLLQLVGRLDACLAELGGINDMRDELLRLHAMALTVIEGVVPTVPTENVSIWEAAESVRLDLETLSSWIRIAQMTIAPLGDLVPGHER